MATVAVAAIAFSACSGGDSSSDDGSGEANTDNTDNTATDTDTEISADESGLPVTSLGFDQVCNTQGGFGGATDFDASAPGPHPVVMFRDNGDGFFSDSSTLPAGWELETDDDFDDNSDLAAAQLVSCLSIVERTPTGVMCDLDVEDDAGNTEVVTLELVDTAYEMRVYAATTAELVGTESFDVVDASCPTFAFIDEGQTQYLNRATDIDVVNALKPYVSPNGNAEVAGAGAELPAFESDFDRICNKQVGFGGVAPLSAGPGPRPVVLMQESDAGSFITSSADLPDGWDVVDAEDASDNSDLAPVELVACSRIVERTPTGSSCDFEGDDGDVTTLALVDVTYQVDVYEASTGALVGSDSIVAASTDCPSFLLISEGDTELLNTPSGDDYVAALTPFVLPG